MAKQDPLATEAIEIPEAWGPVDVARLRGTIMVIGGVDTGKTTFAHYLFTQINEGGPRVALLDSDPGQSTLGPPATMTVALSAPGQAAYPPRGPLWRWFVGDVTPRGRMLPVVVGCGRLAAAALAAGAGAVVVDTSGLIAARQGGVALKLAKIDMLRPRTIFVLQQRNEAQALLTALRHRPEAEVVTLAAAPATRRRTAETRRRYREAQWQRYFAQAGSLTLPYGELAVVPEPGFRPQQVVALRDAEGFTRALAVVEQVDKAAKLLTVQSPLKNAAPVAMIEASDLVLPPL